MECFGIILDRYLECLLYSFFLKVHIFFFWNFPFFRTFLRHKGKAGVGELVLFFTTSSSFFLSIKKHEWFVFPPLISFPILFNYSWGYSWIWKVLFAPMGDLTCFSKPAFWPIRIETLWFWIYVVIIYLDSILLDDFGWCTLIQYMVVLCSNLSLLLCEFCMFD